MDQIKIGNFIAKCRKEKKLTQTQLAEKLNITDRAVSKWENGKSMPDVTLFKELCSILEINLNELLSGEKENNNTDHIILDAVKTNQKQNKKISQGIMLLGVSIAFNLSTIIFGATNQMVVVFGGITFGFIVAGMITLFKK